MFEPSALHKNYLNDFQSSTQGKLDSWWLNMAFVRPEWQGHGILTTFVALVRNKVCRSFHMLSSFADIAVPPQVPVGSPAAKATLACCTTNDKNVSQMST